jgi:dihydroxyacetone kinase
VIVQDDITFFGQCVDGERRGLAGTVLLYKILGAASKSISDVDELYTLAQNINASLYTIGVALDGKTNELEIGQGIHGEKGLRRLENSHE